MKNKTLVISALLIVVAIVAGALVAYSHSAVLETGIAGTSANGQPVVVYNESSNGTTVILYDGDEFKISLQVNPATGFTWDIMSTRGINVLES